MLKKSDVIREGYIKGLKEARRILTEQMQANGKTRFYAHHIETLEALVFSDGSGREPRDYDGEIEDFVFSNAEQFLDGCSCSTTNFRKFSLDEVEVDQRSEYGEVQVTYLRDEYGHPVKDGWENDPYYDDVSVYQVTLVFRITVGGDISNLLNGVFGN